MESALEQYQHLAPGVPLSAKPTSLPHLRLTHAVGRLHQGERRLGRGVYLQINRGGYTAGDR